MGTRLAVLLAIGAALLAGCGAASEIGSNAAADVNGKPVPMALYSALVRAQQHRGESTGVPVDWSSRAGADRLKAIQRNVLSTLVRNAVVEQLGVARHLSVSDAELESGLAQVEKLMGSPAALDDQLAKDGLSRADFRIIFRGRLLESKLNRADPTYSADLKAALEAAHVQIYAPPCQANHTYPNCLKA